MPARGFTLLELMLVVFLIGLTAGGVLMTLPPTDAEQPARDAAEQLLAQIRQVQDEALLSGQMYGLYLAPTGYQFLRLDTGRWQPLAAPATLAGMRDLPAGVQLHWQLGSDRWQQMQQQELTLYQSRLSLHQMQVLQDEAAKAAPVPQVWLDSR
ncbi:MAG: type II secretion system minor pseudopilin GspH, partial [Plesiomonas sp.]